MTRKTYTGDGIDVTFDPLRCRHAAECLRGLPAVFDRKRRPWILPDNAAPADVAAVIRRCPSGALHYALADGPAEEPARPTAVTATQDGPLVVRGDLVINGVSETRAMLCACGRTANRPHCDGACSKLSAG